VAYCPTVKKSLKERKKVSIRLMTEAWKNEQVSGNKLLLLLALCDYANDDGLCYPTVQTLAKKVRVQVRSVQKMLSELRELGLMDRYKSGGGKYPNIYRVTPTPVPADTPVPTDTPPLSLEEHPSILIGNHHITKSKKKSSIELDWIPKNVEYAREHGLAPEQALEFFVTWAVSNGKTYKDWDLTWSNACRTWLKKQGLPTATPSKKKQGEDKGFIQWMKNEGYWGKVEDLDPFRLQYKEEKGKK
jgi:hypothetical protein